MRLLLVIFLTMIFGALPGSAQRAKPPSNTVSAPSVSASMMLLVKSIYPFYPGRAPNSGGGVNWISGSILDPSTLALALVKRAQQQDEVDYVPFCQCQDDGGMQARIGSVSNTSGKSADIRVSLVFPGGGHVRKNIVLHVVDTASGWRVHDITEENGRSYRAGLGGASR